MPRSRDRSGIQIVARSEVDFGCGMPLRTSGKAAA